MPSTRDNPRIAQSGVALTSLGAVGGARGTAAGALRILVEFLTTYDDEAVKELTQDIETVDKKSKFAAAEDEHRQKKLQAVRTQLHHVEANLRNRADAAVRKEVRIQDSLQGVRTKAGKAELAASKVRLTTLLSAQGFTKAEIADINARYQLKQREAKLVRYSEQAEQRAATRARSRLGTEAQLTKIQQVRAQLAPKLSGLAIGAVGGIVGGAILGVGWALADKAIQELGEKIEDAINPAKKAREAIKELGAAVVELAKANDITILEAATLKVKELGLESDKSAASSLAQFAAVQKVAASVDQYTQFIVAGRDKTALATEAIDKIRKALVEEAKARNDAAIATAKKNGVDVTASSFIRTLPFQISMVNGEVVNLIDGTDALTLATQRWNEMLGYSIGQEAASAASKQRLADAAALLTIYQKSLNDALLQQVNIAGESFDSRIAALGEGTSKRTRRLQAALNKASGGGGSSNAQALKNIAEEKALLLLKMRLKLLGTNINLEKYSGKFLLVAINAKIAALQKEGDAQARVNALLDLQYRMSKQTERNVGESISDFIDRRAQEQRGLLQEQADLQREAQIAALESRKEHLEDQLALEELAERKREAMRSAGTSAHVRNLQKQLDASKKADAKALKEKKAALEKQKKDLEAAAKEAIELTQDTAVAETYSAIRGMNSLQDISKFSGRLGGLKRAKSAIDALVEGFGLPRWVAAPFLDKLNGMISAAEAKIKSVPKYYASVYGAEGAVFPLNNASSPFGANVHAGEQGSEIGVILSHNVAKLLQNSKPSVGQVGPFIIQQSDDPYRDKYAFGKLVTKSIEAAL